MIFKIISITIVIVFVFQFWNLSINRLCLKKGILNVFEQGTRTTHNHSSFIGNSYKCKNVKVLQNDRGALLKKNGRSFILNLKNIHDKGFSIFGILIVNTLISILMLQYYQFRSTELKINDRSIHYLCFGKAVKTTNKYIEKTLHLNRLIKATNKVSLLPPLKVKAQIMKQSLQRLQDMFHILFLKNIGTQKYCSLISKLKIINKPPFLSSALGLKRDSQGAARISSLKWGFDFKSKRGIILKVIFNLKRLGDFKTEEIQNGNSYLSYH